MFCFFLKHHPFLDFSSQIGLFDCLASMAQRITFYASLEDTNPMTLDVAPNETVSEVASRLKEALDKTQKCQVVMLLHAINRHIDLPLALHYMPLDSRFLARLYLAEAWQRFYYQVLWIECPQKVEGCAKRVIVSNHGSGRPPALFPIFEKMTVKQFKEVLSSNISHNIKFPSDTFNFWTQREALTNNKKSVRKLVEDLDVVIMARAMVNTASPPNSPIRGINHYVPTVDAFDLDITLFFSRYFSAEALEGIYMRYALTDDPSEAQTDVPDTDDALTEPNAEPDVESADEDPFTDDIANCNGMAINEKTETNFKSIVVKVVRKTDVIDLTYFYGIATTIGDLKECITGRFGTPMLQYSIKMQGSSLENFDCIDTYVGRDVSFLEMTPKVCGGHRGMATKKSALKTIGKTVRTQVLKTIIENTAKSTDIQTLGSVVDASRLEQQFAFILQNVDTDPVKAFETLISAISLENLGTLKRVMSDLSGSGDYKLAKIAPYLFNVAHLLDVKTNLENVISTTESVLQLMSNKANETGRFTISDIKSMVEKEMLRKEGARDASASSSSLSVAPALPKAVVSALPKAVVPALPKAVASPYVAGVAGDVPMPEN